MPPTYCDLIIRISTKEKSRNRKNCFCFFGPPTDDKSELSNLEKGAVAVPSKAIC